MIEAKADRGDGRSRELKLRIVSSIVLIPIILAITWLGGAAFGMLIVVGSVLMMQEWATMVVGPSRAPERIAMFGLVGLSIAMLPLGALLGSSAAVMAMGIILALGLGAAVAMREARLGGDAERMVWAPRGVFYVALPCLSLLGLRGGPHGLWQILFLFAIVWATDIAAYFTGKALGGPKLWPAVSPKKTWSGAIGGLIAAGVAGMAVAHFAGASRLWPVFAVACALSVASQGGDLFESSVKRRFGVKDSGRIIPGHGGILDRVDGLIAAAVLAIVVAALHGGVSSAKGLLFW